MGLSLLAHDDERRFWDTDTTSVLKAHAKDAGDQTDWDGILEVRGLPDIATGFYRYPNNTGGFLQFTLAGESEIMEQGHPHNPEQPKFEELPRRL